MRITVHNYHADLAEALRSYVERRLKFALDRFGGRVDEVTVRICGDCPRCRSRSTGAGGPEAGSADRNSDGWVRR